MGAVYSPVLSGKFGALESIISETRRLLASDLVSTRPLFFSMRRHHEPGSVKRQRSVVGASHRALDHLR